MARKKSDEKNLTTMEDFVKDDNVYVVEDVINLKDSTEEVNKEMENEKFEDDSQKLEDEMTVDETLEEPNLDAVEMDAEVAVKESEVTEMANYKVIVVKTHFPSPATKVTSVIQATGQVDELIAAGGQLKMISGRFYHVPVRTICGYTDIADVTSDDYIIKVTSNMADKIDVKFVKNNLACVSTFVPGFDLQDDMTLCILIPWK